MYTLCLYTLMCLQLIFYLTHIKGINWHDSCNSLFKMGYNDCYGIMIELNISYKLIAQTKFDLMTAIFTLRYCYSNQNSD